jgi:hypothetical protein
MFIPSLIFYYAVGKFNATSATQYCMVISNTQLEGGVFNESSDDDMT